MTHQRSQTNPRGFTLIELLVAMVITTIIVSVLVSITSLAMDTWNRSRSELRAARQAKTMVDSMANDLEALVARRGNTNEWLSAVIDPDLSALGPKSMKSTNASRLVFFTAATDRYNGDIGTAFPANAGDVSCVGYQVRYQNPFTRNVDPEIPAALNFNSFVLYRLLVNPNDTFTNLLGKAGVSPLPSLDTVFTGALSQAKNFVCENISQFTITFHVAATHIDTSTSPSTSKLIDVPVSIGKTISVSSGNPIVLKELHIMGTGLQTLPTDISSALPAPITADEFKAGRVTGIEVSVSVISDLGIDQLKKRKFVDDANETAEQKKAKFLGQNSYQYSKRVQVPSM